MKKTLTALAAGLCIIGTATAQVPAPTPKNSLIAVKGGYVHVGDGKTVIPNGTVVIQDSLIRAVLTAEQSSQIPPGAQIVDVTGQHVYPGIIAINTTLGLTDIDAIRATRDFAEVGNFTPHVRALIAYNTDSDIIPTVRYNGVLIAQSTPQGGTVSGRSSMMELDGWNWAEAVVRADDGVHVNFPDISTSPLWREPEKFRQESVEEIQRLRALYDDARAWCSAKQPAGTPDNAVLSALCASLQGTARTYVHARSAKAMMLALDFFASYGIRPVIVGGADALIIAERLRRDSITVVVSETHRLPSRLDEDIWHPYRLPAMLARQGVSVALAADGAWQQRNLPFQAGTVAAFGATREEALAMVTGKAAEATGIDAVAGTLVAGKHATLFVSKGDALDMASNSLTHAFVRGRAVPLTSRQVQLYEKFSERYRQSGK